MPQQTFTTNLRCGACLASIKPVLDAEQRIQRWSVDLAAEGKPLTIESAEGYTPSQLNQLLAPAGYQTLQEVKTTSPAMEASTAEPKASYYPLLLILLYLLGIVAVIEWNAGTFVLERAMRHFMAGFFLVFSFFKLLDVQKFADAYATYDIVAHRSRPYALAYPFIELALGFAFLLHLNPFVTNLITLIVMSVSIIGVLETNFNKRRIQCACLGTVFTLPMSVVTVIEDGLMIAMSAAMLLM
jgi:cation transport ATPase